ncbi:uncharacterized protein LOC143596475 [Bidens hawaiensis]|uniref:uncharacterized protein LOC143596475 n=1 Tax=Bidens hawaiensis TaxID=980011 RepID=UPI0040493CE5
MTTTFDSKHVAIVLVILIIHNVFQTDSASIQPNQGTIFSGRNRMLRKLPTTPPPPNIGQPPHYKLPCPPPSPPPPPPLTSLYHIYPSFRTVGRGSPPAPRASRPRNYRIFLSPPPMPPPPPPSPSPPPPPPPPAWMYRRPSKCNLAPPPPKSS